MAEKHRALCPVRATVIGGGGARVALVDDAGHASYADLDAAAARAAAFFVRQGLAHARVAVRAPTSRALVALHVGAARAAVSVVPLNLRHGPAEHAHCIDAAGCIAVLDDAAVHAAVAHGHGVDVDVGVDVDIDIDVGPVLFTSGTSGRPKGARLPLRNFRASTQIASAIVDAHADDVWLLCLPLFHVGGLAMMWRALAWGAALRLMPTVDVNAIATLAAAGAVQHVSVVATTLGAWLRAPGLAPTPAVKAILVGGGPVSAALLDDARRAGLPVVWTWGMTETTSQACTASPREPARASAAPLGDVVVDVRDDDGAPVAAGVVGHVFVKGSTLFAGYLGDDGVVVDERGFFATGDLGSVDDDGRLAIAARRTDLILSGGENLYPAEIEGVLARAPGVVEVAVVGVDDDRFGQRPIAFVVGDIDVDALAAYAAAALPKIKRPDTYVCCAALPKNGANKLDRAALQRDARAHAPRPRTS